MSLPPANWYPDPTAPGTERYWDGSAWGASTRAMPAPQVSAVPMFPPPATAEPMLAPKRSRLGLWITLGAVGLVVVGLVAVGILTVRATAPNASPNYAGAPVAAGDTAPPGNVEVISDATTVAFDIPTSWIDATTLVDFSSVHTPLPEGQSTIGTWFTGDPGTDASAQLVSLTEQAPTPGVRGRLDDLQQGVVDAASKSPSTTHVGPTTTFTTHIGLEGERTTISLALADGIAANMVNSALGHGRRLVFVSWTAYNGEPDQAALTALLESLRIDE
jgi:hypothetical protein